MLIDTNITTAITTLLLNYHAGTSWIVWTTFCAPAFSTRLRSSSVVDSSWYGQITKLLWFGPQKLVSLMLIISSCMIANVWKETHTIITKAPQIVLKLLCIPSGYECKSQTLLIFPLSLDLLIKTKCYNYTSNHHHVSCLFASPLSSERTSTFVAPNRCSLVTSWVNLSLEHSHRTRPTWYSLLEALCIVSNLFTAISSPCIHVYHVEYSDVNYQF